jgi:DivIVA domain-containing protein
VALERQDIEKKDFPVGRRGYDPEAVDSHLSTIADEVERLSSQTHQRSETLATAASEQIRTIIEAAEQTAAQIQADAEREAREIRGDATVESRRERDEASAEAQRERDEAAAAAQSEREQASAQAREYVGQVSSSTSQMLERLEAMESELSALGESLRTGANRLTAELELLESEMKDLSGVGATELRATDHTAAEHEAVVEPELGPDLEAEHEVEPIEEPEEELLAPAEVADTAPEEELEEPTAVTPAEAGAGGDDTEGARLIALNMALNGTPREETERYLAENFELPNRGKLLDEVYASVEG